MEGDFMRFDENRSKEDANEILYHQNRIYRAAESFRRSHEACSDYLNQEFYLFEQEHLRRSANAFERTKYEMVAKGLELQISAYKNGLQYESSGNLERAAVEFRKAAVADYSDASFRLAKILSSIAQRLVQEFDIGIDPERDPLQIYAELVSEAARWYVEADEAGEDEALILLHGMLEQVKQDHATLCKRVEQQRKARSSKAWLCSAMATQSSHFLQGLLPETEAHKVRKHLSVCIYCTRIFFRTQQVHVLEAQKERKNAVALRNRQFVRECHERFVQSSSSQGGTAGSDDSPSFGAG